MAANDTTPLIEKRSIDYIPEVERHGRLLSQFTLWMGANLQITAIVTGALAVVLGGDVFWSLIGLLIGQLLGGGVMALLDSLPAGRRQSLLAVLAQDPRPGYQDEPGRVYGFPFAGFEVHFTVEGGV